MFGNRFQRGIFFSPDDKGAGGDKKGLEGTQGDKKGTSGTDNKQGSDKKDGEGGDDDDDSEEEGDLTEEELAALAPKVRKAIEKKQAEAAAEAEAKTKANLAAEAKAKVDKEKTAKREADLKKAKEDGDKDAVIKSLEADRDDWKNKYDDLLKTTHQTGDEAKRLKAAAKYKLPDGLHDNLGSDPEKYEEQAKKLSKQLTSNSRGPELEGGQRNNKGTKEQQDKVAREAVRKFVF